MTRNPLANGLATHRRTTRMIAFALWMAIWVYVLIYVTQILKGDPRGFLAPIGQAPWGNPFLPVLCGLAVLMPMPALLLRSVMMARAARAHDEALRWGLERAAMIVTMALFESVGIYGLVLGFALGPSTAPVSALMFLVPLVLNPFFLPPHARAGDGDGSGLRPS